MAADKDDAKDDDAKGGGKKKLILIMVAVLAIAGAAYFLVLKPKGDAAAAAGAPSPSPSYVAGAVVPLDSITINLAGGHFLKLGMALQTAEGGGGHGDVDGSKALDAAIELFSNKPLDELADAKGREHAKEELVEEVTHLYHGGVYDIYFTEFVMQ